MMKILFSSQYYLLLLFLSFGTLGHSQLEFPEDKVSAKFSVNQNGCEATIIAKVTTVPKWHINAVKLPKGSFLFPTSLTLKKGDGFVVSGGNVEPKPHYMRDEMADEDLFFHEGTFSIKQKITISSEKDFVLEGGFTFQTCNDVKCLPDYTYPIKVNIKGCKTEAVAEIVGVEKEFVSNKNGIATTKNGEKYVSVSNKWQKVPEGNSPEFYKKYLEIKDNE